MRGRVLVAEDDEALRGLYQGLLQKLGCEVTAVPDGAAALVLASREEFDAILTDIAMPHLDGVRFLQALRDQDPIVPVLLVTGQPELSTAQQAVEHRAFRYLAKPVDLKSLAAAVGRAAGLCRWVRARAQVAQALGEAPGSATVARGPERSFGRAVGLLRARFFPVVGAQDGKIRGFSLAAQSMDPDLSELDRLVALASHLGQQRTLWRALWSLAPARTTRLGAGRVLFVATDAQGLTDPELLSPESALGSIARQVVLVLTDRTGLEHLEEPESVIGELRAFGYRLAVDHIATGYAGLNALALIAPEFVMLDACLVRHIDSTAEQRKLAGTLISLTTELGAELIAEGVSSLNEAQTLVELGCPLLSWDIMAAPDDLSPVSAQSMPRSQPPSAP